jgi:hypothetical protein
VSVRLWRNANQFFAGVNRGALQFSLLPGEGTHEQKAL